MLTADSYLTIPSRRPANPTHAAAWDVLHSGPFLVASLQLLIDPGALRIVGRLRPDVMLEVKQRLAELRARASRLQNRVTP